MDHPPGTTGTLEDPTRVNMGRYDIMMQTFREIRLRVTGEGLVPYHGMHMSRIGPTGQPNGWLPVNVSIVQDTLGLRVPDVRSPNAVLYEVPALGSAPVQSFLLINHQGSTPYDQKYLNTGLLAWHVLRSDAGYRIWDLESARGRFNANGQADPVNGRDSLEASALHLGLAEDFFDDTPADTLACNTNPNTNLYEGTFPQYYSPQSVPTLVSFENIRAAGDGSGDAVVDVYVTPKQLVLSPNGGELLCVTTPIRWAVRACAGANRVDILLSADGGANYNLTLATGEENDGEYLWTPTTNGDMFRVRVVSNNDAANAVGMDDSDANFSVGPCGGGGCPVVYQGEPNHRVAANNALSRCFQFRENGAARTTDLLVLSEPGNGGRYDLELREPENYYSAFDALELELFDVPTGAAIASTMDARPVAFSGRPRPAGSATAVEGLPGRVLSPDSVIYALPGTVVEYEWPSLPPATNAVILVETNLKIPPCDPGCTGSMTQTGRVNGTGLLVEQWRRGAWQFVGDLVPRLDWERVALELPESSEGPLRVRVRWEGTHNFRMIGWVAEAGEVEPSYRLGPQDVHHSTLGPLGDVLDAVDGIPALLTPEDVISFTFDPAELNEGMERHVALRFHGRYSHSLEGLGIEGRPGRPSGVSVARQTVIAISGSNPFNPATTWKLDLAATSFADLRIYDARGSLLRRLLSGRLEAGVHTIRWDGRNEEGQQVPSGIYFWRFDGAGLRRAEKFVVLK
jgi:hypothetical protein